MGAEQSTPNIEPLDMSSPLQIRRSGIADLESIVRKWAVKSATSLGIRIPAKTVPQIKWDRVKFTRLQTQWVKDMNVPTPPNTIIYSSSFANNTDRDAEHTLRIERSSTATYKTLVTDGFSTSFDLGLYLDLPEEVARAAVEFDRAVKLDRTEETILRQKQTWSVDTKIPAPPKSLTRARVEIQENQWTGTFSTDVAIKGKVLVNFFDPSNPGTHVAVIEDDIVKVLLEFEGVQAFRNGNGKMEAHWLLKGNCDFTFGVEQMVLVDHEKLPH